MIRNLMHDITDSAVKYTKIPESWVKFIKEPRSIVTVKFPVETKTGTIETITGTRIIASNHHLPTKGGLRFSVHTSLEDLEGLASLMSYKASLHDVPFGGAKGCIFIDPNKYTYEEKVRIVRRFTIEMWKRSMISPSTDVMGVDSGTNQVLMNVIKETYTRIRDNNDVETDSVVTGKTLALGGIGVSSVTAGYGVARAAKFIEENMSGYRHLKESGLGLGKSKKSVIIDGFAETGYDIARFLSKGDFKIIGITDGEHGCFNAAGFDPQELWEYKKSHNGLQGISKTMNKPNEIVTQKCDILITTKELSITKTLAENLKCKMVIEGANASLTKESLEILNNRRIVVIPDILSFSGSFICSYLEWLKNIEHKNLTLLFKRFESNSRKTMIEILSTSSFGSKIEDNYAGPEEDELVLSTIEEIQDNSFKSVLKEAESFNIDIRTAAYKIAIERIFHRYKSLGEVNIC